MNNSNSSVSPGTTRVPTKDQQTSGRLLPLNNLTWDSRLRIAQGMGFSYDQIMQVRREYEEDQKLLLAQNQRKLIQSNSNPKQFSNVETQAKPIDDADNNSEYVKTVQKYMEYVFTSNDQELKAKVAQAFLYRFPVQVPGMEDTYGQILSLAQVCDESILKNLTDENVLDFYVFGEQVDSQRLMNGCMDYIKKNKKTIWKDATDLVEASKKNQDLIYKLFLSS